MRWYQRCGIEPPLPLRSVLAWPVLWAYGWIAEKVHRPIVHDPEDLLIASYDRYSDYVRLTVKDWNKMPDSDLPCDPFDLSAWRQLLDITDWFDSMGIGPRWSDVVAKIEMYWPEGVPMPEELSQADYLTAEFADLERFRFSPLYEDHLHSEPYRLAWQGQDGVVHVEEVTREEWLNTLSGNGSVHRSPWDNLNAMLSWVNPCLPPLKPIRDRLAEIVSDNYEDEWGYPTADTFDEIADAILEEFEVTPR